MTNDERLFGLADEHLSAMRVEKRKSLIAHSWFLLTIPLSATAGIALDRFRSVALGLILISCGLSGVAFSLVCRSRVRYRAAFHKASSYLQQVESVDLAWMTRDPDWFVIECNCLIGVYATQSVANCAIWAVVASHVVSSLRPNEVIVTLFAAGGSTGLMFAALHRGVHRLYGALEARTLSFRS